MQLSASMGGQNGHSVTRQVIERIRAALVAGELAPGDKLPTEPELCGMWHVSRTPIREAVKVLEFMGVLEIRRSEGTFVCTTMRPAAVNPLVLKLQFLTDSADQLLEFRREVDLMVVRLAIVHAADDDLIRMEASIAQMESAPPGTSVASLMDLELDFHHAMASATGNALIAELAEELYGVFAESVKRSHATGGTRGAIGHHRRMLTAVRARSLSLAEEAVDESLAAWRGYLPVVRRLPSRGGGEPRV